MPEPRQFTQTEMNSWLKHDVISPHLRDSITALLSTFPNGILVVPDPPDPVAGAIERFEKEKHYNGRLDPDVQIILDALKEARK